ncbi:hypothetical protein ACVK01_002358 [Paenibacillus sp. PvR148]
MKSCGQQEWYRDRHSLSSLKLETAGFFDFRIKYQKREEREQ